MYLKLTLEAQTIKGKMNWTSLKLQTFAHQRAPSRA